MTFVLASLKDWNFTELSTVVCGEKMAGENPVQEESKGEKLEGFSDETFITNLRREKSASSEKGQEVKA